MKRKKKEEQDAEWNGQGAIRPYVTTTGFELTMTGHTYIPPTFRKTGAGFLDTYTSSHYSMYACSVSSVIVCKLGPNLHFGNPLHMAWPGLWTVKRLPNFDKWNGNDYPSFVQDNDLYTLHVRPSKSIACLKSGWLSRKSISRRFWSVAKTRNVLCFFKAGCNTGGIVPDNEIIIR